MMVSNISGFFTPKLGEDEPILTSIFFKGVGEKPPTSNCLGPGNFHHDSTSRISDSHSEYWNRLGDLFSSGVNGEFKSSSLWGICFYTSSKPLFSKSNVFTSWISRRCFWKIFYFQPYLGKISKLTNIFQIGWNHQPDICLASAS